MKKNNDPFIRLRIITASITLAIIFGAWLLYGYNFLKTNPAKILNKLSNEEKDNIDRLFNEIDLKKEQGYTINIDDKDKLYLYYTPQELYIYNNKEYYSHKLNLDSKSYKKILESLIDSFTHNYKILDKTKKQDNKKDYYIYTYSLNEISPLINTLKTNKEFTDIIKKLNIKDINKYNKNSIGLNIITQGKKRNIIYYNLKIDNLFDIYKEKNYLSGFFLNYSFTYNKNLIIYTENNEYYLNIEKNNTKFKKTNYKKTKLKKILSIIK